MQNHLKHGAPGPGTLDQLEALGLDLSATETGRVVMGSWGSGSTPWIPLPEVRDQIPDLRFTRSTFPPFPLIPRRCGSRGKLGHLALAWVLAFARQDKVIRPKWKAWPHSITGPLAASADLLQSAGVSPTAMAVIRWNDWIEWSGGPWPKGPGVLFTPGRVAQAMDRARAYQARVTLVPLGPAAHTVLVVGEQIRIALAREQPRTAEHAHRIVQTLAPDPVALVSAANAEQALAGASARDSVGLRLWPWPSR